MIVSHEIFCFMFMIDSNVILNKIILKCWKMFFLLQLCDDIVMGKALQRCVCIWKRSPIPITATVEAAAVAHYSGVLLLLFYFTFKSRLWERIHRDTGHKNDHSAMSSSGLVEPLRLIVVCTSSMLGIWTIPSHHAVSGTLASSGLMWPIMTRK